MPSRKLSGIFFYFAKIVQMVHVSKFCAKVRVLIPSHLVEISVSLSMTFQSFRYIAIYVLSNYVRAISYCILEAHDTCNSGKIFLL